MPGKPQSVSFNVNWSTCLRCGACVAVCLQRKSFTSSFDTIAVQTPCEIACMLCTRACPTSSISSQSVNKT